MSHTETCTYRLLYKSKVKGPQILTMNGQYGDLLQRLPTPAISMVFEIPEERKLHVTTKS